MSVLNERQRAALRRGLATANDELLRQDYLEKVAAGVEELPELQEMFEAARLKRSLLIKLARVQLDADATTSGE